VNGKPISEFISEFGSRHRGAIYFILVAASIWFGIMGSCKEIVTEQHILKRELRSCVNLMPYLLAKMSMLILLLGIQTAILTAIVALFLLKLQLVSSLILWTVLWTAAVASASMGLCISCFSPTYRVALTVVPFIMIFQLVFGGLIRPLVKMDDNTSLPRYIASLTFQRWAFEASLSVDSFAKGDVLEQLIDEKPPTTIIDEFSIIQYRNSNILKSFFRVYDTVEEIPIWNSFFIPMGFLVGFSMLFLCISYWTMKIKFLL
jgi:hypothetical protein